MKKEKRFENCTGDVCIMDTHIYSQAIYLKAFPYRDYNFYGPVSSSRNS
jgi:hypothetical protein